MRYQVVENSQYPYPDNAVSPDTKGREWCMAYAKASYSDWNYGGFPKGVFSNNFGDYEKNRMYALGKQPVSQYKKLMGVDEQTNNTWLSIDWTVRGIVAAYRDRAISRLMEKEHSVIATPIDILAKSELDEYYSEMKAKIMVRRLLEKTNKELASHPYITLQSGEPMDLEELEMRVELGEQFNRSKDAELAIAVGFYENDFLSFRRKIYEDLFDCGVAGYKEWLGEDNKAKFRYIDPESVITSISVKPDFSDIVHAGELIDVSLVDLALVRDENGEPMFNEKQLTEFASSISGRWGNPATLGATMGWLKPYDKFKCKVLDIEFFSYNDYTFTDRTDKNGNPVFRQEEYGRGSSNNPRYVRKRVKCVYKCKWIVGTDYCYDWGLKKDQKRYNDPTRKAETTLSYKFIAYNFYKMKAQSFMDRLIPFLDEYQLTVYKIQNFKNRAVPSGWWIDLDALENVAMNKGGKNMEPKELLQMFFETGALIGRSKDAAGQPHGPNWKPVIPIENTAASELAMFYQDLVNTITMIEKITGYNDITMGEGNPKTLVPGYQTAEMSTTHALYPLKYAEEYLTRHLAEDVLLRMQQGIKKGGISGYAPAINSNTLQFIKISESICLRDYGITLDQKTSDDQKMWLLQQMQADISNGFLDTSDAVMLVNTMNVKQAQSIWSYRVKKSKEALHRQEMEKIELNNQGQMQQQMQSAQIKQQETMMAYQFELQKQQNEIKGRLIEKQMMLASQERIAAQTNQTKITEQAMENSGKTTVAEINADAKVSSTAIQGEQSIQKQDSTNETTIVKEAIASSGAIAKQKEANKKPQSKSSK